MISMSPLKLKNHLISHKSLQSINTLQSDMGSAKSKPRKKRQHTTQHKKIKNRKEQNKRLTQIYDHYYYSKEDLQKIDNIFRKESKVKITGSTSKKTVKKQKNITIRSNQKIDQKVFAIGSRFIGDKIKTESRVPIKKIKSQANLIKNKLICQEKIPHKKHLIGQVLSLKKPKNQKTKQLLFVKTQKKIVQSKPKIEIIKNYMGQQSTPSFTTSDDIQIMNMAQQGIFGKIFIGKIKKTGEIIAIKRILLDPCSENRQKDIIKLLHNDFIVEILGTYTKTEGKLQFLNIMMKYYDSNLSHRIKQNKSPMNSLEMKIIIYQIFKGLSYLHSINICHRDIKPANILIKGYAAVLCDFSSAKIIDSRQTNISYIGMRNYRAPEIAFGATSYTTAIDIWSAGCIILQIINRSSIFNGETSIDHIYQIINCLGTPTLKQVKNMNPDYNLKQFIFPWIKKKDWVEIFPNADKLLLNLISQIMVYSPQSRITAIETLNHAYFDQIRDEVTYEHIKSQYHLKDFFNFSEDQVRGYSNIKSNLIPHWYAFQ